MNYQRGTVLVVVLSTVIMSLMTGCADRDLTRDEAAAAINAKSSFPKSEFRDLGKRFGKRDDTGELFVYNWPYDSLPPPPEIARFVESGLLTTESTGERGNIFEWINLAFTDSTKAFAGTAEHELNIRFKVCELVFGEVTGIRPNKEAGTAVVEYTVRRANWTPFGEYYRTNDALAYPEVIQRQAAFSRYDDGWRITDLGAESSE